jgi:hypothetical protein
VYTNTIELGFHIVINQTNYATYNKQTTTNNNPFSISTFYLIHVCGVAGLSTLRTRVGRASRPWPRRLTFYWAGWRFGTAQRVQTWIETGYYISDPEEENAIFLPLGKV